MKSETLGTVVQITERYPLQSYFDALAEATTPKSMAVLVQPTGEPIIKSTKKSTDNQSGYCIAVTPDSEAPLAISFDFGDAGASAVVVVRPGEVYVPAGDKQFKGFSYGLPFGWLGGGVVTFNVYKSPNARVDFASKPDKVLFHRFRTTILAAPAGAFVPPEYVNWPSKFPWNKAYFYQTGVAPAIQASKPSMVIKEPEAVLRLNTGGVDIAATNVCRMVFFGTDAFGIGADGVTASSADNLFYDLNWPIPTNIAVGTDAKPVIDLPLPIARLASNQWGVAIYAPALSALIGMTVDIARYGRL